MSETLLNPEFITTFVIFGAAVVIAVLMIWLDRRPKDSLSPSLVPTTGILMVSSLVVLLALVHLVNLAGIQTGR